MTNRKEQSVSDQLRNLLPEPSEELSAALDKVAQLEHEYSATVEQARAERAFLERAPREGLLYPGDALKLDDLKLGEDLDEVFSHLKATRPYLFAKPSSPANQKLAEQTHSNNLTHGSLTRQLQQIRRRKR